MPRSFAIIPAAGRSVRMGQPKLLLPWGPSTVIETVLKAWRSGGVDELLVVVHPDDAHLARLCQSSGARVIVPATPPADMKASIMRGLEALAASGEARPDDVWLMAPADIPELDPKVVTRLLAEARVASQTILAPCKHGKRGHPVLFPWPLAAEVANLPAGVGIDHLLEQRQVRLVECGAGAAPRDIDTPGDYDDNRPGSIDR